MNFPFILQAYFQFFFFLGWGWNKSTASRIFLRSTLLLTTYENNALKSPKVSSETPHFPCGSALVLNILWRHLYPITVYTTGKGVQI